jgi:hypothetical protein
MIAAFLRHGSDAVLVVGLLAALVAFTAGWFTFSLIGATIGALVFFVSEYRDQNAVERSTTVREIWRGM